MDEATRYCLGCMENSAGAPLCPHCGYVAGTVPESILHLTPGVVLKQRYLVGRVLGDGGFGITYLGRDLVLDSKVAIKEYFPSGVAVRTRGEPHVFPASASFRQDFQWGMERFLDEARLVRKFKDHPNVVRVEDFFPENDTAYMILEFLDGITLEKYLEQHGGKIDWQSAVNCLGWVMDALREVHSAGVLHRDISPDNIFLVRSGHVKVIDFGAARQAMGQKSVNLSVILKHGYAPFEQYESKGQQGPWTDVYAASATLYRAITGQMPPAAPDRFSKDTLVRPSALGVAIPADKEEVLLKGLALRVEDRYQDMLSIENALLGRGGHPPPPGLAPQPASLRPPPAPPLAWIAGGLIALVGIVIAYYSFSAPSKAPIVNAFRAEPPSIVRGAALTLFWDVTGADSVEIEGLGKQPPVGKLSVSPKDNATYTLVAKPKRGPELRKQVQVAVGTPASARILRFEAAPATVNAGEAAVLSWQVENGRDVKLDGVSVQTTGNKEFRELATRAFTLEATGLDGVRQSAQATIGVKPLDAELIKKVDNKKIPPGPDPVAPPPRVVSFVAMPGTLQAGQTATLHWSVANAARVSIAPDLGPVALTGDTRVQPQRTTRYTLTATGAQGRETSASTTVHVQAEDTPTPIPTPGPVPRGLAWPMAHDHEGLQAFNPYDRNWNHCEGTLRLNGQTLRFDTRFPGDSFVVPLSEIEEMKMNRMPIRGMKAFHIKLRSGRKFNFVSEQSADQVIDTIQRARR